MSGEFKYGVFVFVDENLFIIMIFICDDFFKKSLNVY